ncbi:MAG: hypothetical protein JW976_15710 [Syntrophaceae bacterium]|nr:hypothetical protein [Syntrophaceae bacterium]
MNNNVIRTSSLMWLRVLLLTPMAVIGGFIGQIAFDLINTNPSTYGKLNSFLIDIIIQPIVHDFWHAFGISIALLRWVFGSGALALSISFYLRVSAKKLFGMFLAGCFLGFIGFLLVGFLLEVVPMEVYRWLAVPYTVERVMPPMIICFLIGLILKETRSFSWKFALAGFLGGLLGTKLIIFSSMELYQIIDTMLINIGLQHVNAMRLIETFFIMLFTNFLCLSFLNESLRYKEIKATKGNGGRS